jgi:hypothetical protein
MPDFKTVTRAELDAFVRGYPRKLERDVFFAGEPPMISWNDFERAPMWPDSVVASATGDRCSIIVDIHSPVADDGKRDTDKPLFDANGIELHEGDSVLVRWSYIVGGVGAGSEDIRKDKIMIRDQGTKYERWSLESCGNNARSLDLVKA